MNTQKKVAVVLGSGSSFDSGYEMEIKHPPRHISLPGSLIGSALELPKEHPRIRPPMDKGFFHDPAIWNATIQYNSLERFFRLYFGFSSPSGIGLEEVWSSVDLNHKHITLETYDWSSETNQYLSRDLFQGATDFHDTDPSLIGVPGNSCGGTRYKFLGDCGRDLRRLVYAIYGHPLPPDTNDNFSFLHKQLIDMNCDVEYVTFNYDFLLERSLERKRYPFGYLIDVMIPDKEIFHPGYSHILKLHGSLTWEHKRPSLQPILLPRSFLSGDQKESIFHAIEPRYDIPGHFVEPAIIPPTWFKQEINDDSRTHDRLTQFILHQWRAALLALSLADIIIVIGYSFPPTDFHAQRLFRLALMKKTEMMPIIYCTGENDKVALDAINFLPDKKCRVEHVKGFSELCKNTILKTCLLKICE